MGDTGIEDLRVLLFQIRDHGPVREEEFQSFLRHGGLSAHQLDRLNVFDQASFDPDVVGPYDAILVGGASEASVLEPERYGFVTHLVAALKQCIQLKKPVFASCFGFQAAALGLGGTVVREEGDFEMGTIPLSLTAAADSDPLFSELEDGFLAVSCHRESVREAPQGCIALAHSPTCLHAFRVGELPFWAFQFHPELDKRCFVERLGVFQTNYTDSNAAYESIASRFEETPASNQLLGRFLIWVAHQSERTHRVRL